MKEFRAEAKTIEEAINLGLEELGLRRDQINWTVEQEPKSGFLGFGSKKAIVLIKEKFRKNRAGGRFHKGKAGNRSYNRRDFKKNHVHSDDYSHRTGRYGYEDARIQPQETEEKQAFLDHKPRKERRMRRRERIYNEEPLVDEFLNIQFVEDPVEHAKEVLSKILSLTGTENFKIEDAKLEEGGALISLSFSCETPSDFTRDNGRMLQALQFMLNTIINKKREPHLALRLDTDGYWEAKKNEISEAVERAIACVKASGHVYRLDPMPATMRKLVHTLVQEQYPDMKTASEGEGRWRKVVIMPKPEGEEASEPVQENDDDDFSAEPENTDNGDSPCCCEECKCEETAEMTENAVEENVSAENALQEEDK